MYVMPDLDIDASVVSAGIRKSAAPRNKPNIARLPFLLSPVYGVFSYFPFAVLYRTGEVHYTAKKWL